MLRNAIVFAAAALACACATLPEPGPSSGTGFELGGRVAVRYGKEGASGRISWRHSSEADEILITSPLGQGVARIKRAGDEVELVTSDERVFRAADAESLTERVLGWRLPLAGLPDWVQGMASPGRPADLRRDAAGRLVELLQDDWKIEFQEHENGVEVKGPSDAAPPVARRYRDPADSGPMDEVNSGERRYPAPAKLNLFLHVVGRRADGYHLIQTVFRLIDCCDWLRFSPRTDAEVRLAQPVPGVEENSELCVRAARLLQATTGCNRGVDIAIEKHIPVGGGLGGGSSDCATTLAVLNRLWELRLPPEPLAGLALQLGADVPFFLSGGNAFAEGVGERLTPLDLPAAWYAVLVPPVAVSTPEIFAAPELTRNTKTVTISSFSAGFWHNDLEPVVCGRHAVVAAHLAWLKQRGNARMSGSGACVFAEFATEREARSVVASMPADMRGFAARGLDRHPGAALLQEG